MLTLLTNLCPLFSAYASDKSVLYLVLTLLQICVLYLVLTLLQICVLYWWLVRVILVVDWLFLPQKFGPVVGTYKSLLLLCECTLRWRFYLQVLGTPNHYLLSSNFFSSQVVGTLKPSLKLPSPPRPYCVMNHSVHFHALHQSYERTRV